MKYLDADRLKAGIKRLQQQNDTSEDKDYPQYELDVACGYDMACDEILRLIDIFQQEQQMPDSTQLIAEWEKEKAVLEQKDFRGDAERMAYNAFLDGFAKGLGYEGTK